MRINMRVFMGGLCTLLLAGPAAAQIDVQGLAQKAAGTASNAGPRWRRK
jgi:hypothetical protein